MEALEKQAESAARTKIRRSDDDYEKDGVIPRNIKGFMGEGETLNENDKKERIGEEHERPEDAIPDLPENAKAREFLKNAPTRGLWQPLGKEVKVMQCWRCRAYGHRTNDRECPLFQSGNILLDGERREREDPANSYNVNDLGDVQEDYERVQYLMTMVKEMKEQERNKNEKKKAKKKDSKKSRKREKKKKLKKEKKKKLRKEKKSGSLKRKREDADSSDDSDESSTSSNSDSSS